MTTETGKSGGRVEAMLSVVMHVALLGACAWYFRNPIVTTIIAAGAGEGIGESAIEVSTVEGKLFSLTTPRSASAVGSEENTPNTVDVTTETAPPDPNSEVLPSTKPTPIPKDTVTTNRPTIQNPQYVSPVPMSGRSPNNSVEVGRSPGSPVPAVIQGVGLVNGNIQGVTDGLPGGSAYGRIIQRILSNNYRPPATNDVGEQYVIVQIRIARDGRILSVQNGRVTPNAFKRRSANSLINYSVERAVVASNEDKFPPFPNGFLVGVQEAVAEVWFKYPK